MSVKDILSNTIRPVFKRHLDQHEVFNKQRIKYKSKLDNDTHEQQEWKKGDYVDTLRWIIQDTQEVEENLALLIPPLLILVDDYDIEYKVMGIQLIHTLMTKVEIDVLSQHGIDKVFSESMFSCLLYLSEERDIPLIKVAYPCLLHLISCIKNKETRLSLYERVLSDGLLVAFAHAGDKIAFLPHLLVHIPRLYHELQWIGVKYLKTLIPYLCHLLSSSPSIRTRHLNPFIIDALVTIIQWCWPR
ncbi:hypothetical protein BDB01DRAFT_294724 [Pilobolus umbonatus]|nr:hypothetical protein BDB01DRAFT_294724 [Pilobolus umbonatus]